jgi:type II secretory pathway pseudopilin PulG
MEEPVCWSPSPEQPLGSALRLHLPCRGAGRSVRVASGHAPSARQTASSRRRLGLSGYTIVELMMSIAVFMVGVTGVVAMQRVSVASNQYSKNLALATRIAESWMDELTAESSTWNETDDFGETVWLGLRGDPGTAPAWFRPLYDAGRRFGGAFDALGTPVPELQIPSDAHYCSHLRLTWMFNEEDAKAGNGLIRAEVRVFWRRAGVAGLTAQSAPAHVCAHTIPEFETALANGVYHVVYLSTTIRQHLAQEL